MEIASVRVHRIVATAFLGEPPTKEHVVDHIDTNKRNNRPENLRWVTKFENIVLNPITSKRIELVCGSVEAFLADPSKFRDKFPEQNLNWMCDVTAEEAQVSLQRMLEWSRSDSVSSGGTLGDWIYNRYTVQRNNTYNLAEYFTLTKAITFNARQRDWEIPSEFPCCPQEISNEPLKDYAENLKKGAIFCRNTVYSSLVTQTALSTDFELIHVITESTKGKSAIKPWALAKITFEDGLFVHTALGSFFSQSGVEKALFLEKGLEWTGGDSIDDFC